MIHPDQLETARRWAALVAAVLGLYRAQRDLSGWYRMRAYSA